MPKADGSVRIHSCIEHILKYCSQIEETLAEIQYSKERFMAAHTYQNAVAMCLLQIGELTKRLPSDFMKEHLAIPWSLIAKMRDFYAHHYGSTDPEMIWNTAVEDIPALKMFCEEYMRVR